MLREMQEQQMQELKKSPAAFLESCDVAAFVFDGSSIESFKAAHQLLLQCADMAQDSLPCIMIAAKDDLGISMVTYHDVSSDTHLCLVYLSTLSRVVERMRVLSHYKSCSALHSPPMIEDSDVNRYCTFSNPYVQLMWATDLMWATYLMWATNNVHLSHTKYFRQRL